MKVRLPLIVFSLLALFMAFAYLDAETSTVGLDTGMADGIGEQRFDKKLWGQSGSRTFTKKSFPLKEWNMHFSSIGSKRAPIGTQDGFEKKMSRMQGKSFEKKEFTAEMSRWNEKIKELHKAAGIQMDDKAQLVADQRLYSMLLQDSQQFREMAEEVSLRDLNRFQFRRNRTDEGIPVEEAGAEN